MPETKQPTREEIEEIVRIFAVEALFKLRHQASSMTPGGDSGLPPDIWHQDVLERTMEPREWLTMALYGAGLIEADPHYIYEICQSLAEWLFAIPGNGQYEIPQIWSEKTAMGALWSAAMIRLEGDELITLAEAARLSGIPLTTLATRIANGKLRSYTNPDANQRQGKRLVRRRDVLAMRNANDN